MRDSHRSLRDDYQVSCRELDLMTEIAVAQRGVIGARMTGGGFGGCTINLVEASAVDEFKRQVSAQYYAKTGQRPEIYVSSASEGAQQMDVGTVRPAT
jgi:galactokinase